VGFTLVSASCVQLRLVESNLFKSAVDDAEEDIDLDSRDVDLKNSMNTNARAGSGKQGDAVPVPQHTPTKTRSNVKAPGAIGELAFFIIGCLLFSFTWYAEKPLKHSDVPEDSIA